LICAQQQAHYVILVMQEKNGIITTVTASAMPNVYETSKKQDQPVVGGSMNYKC